MTDKKEIMKEEILQEESVRQSGEGSSEGRKGKIDWQKAKRIGMVVLIALVLGGVALLWNNSRYLTTDNAKVTSDIRTVVSSTGGKIISWKVAEGDPVMENDVIASLENGLDLRSPISGKVVESQGIVNQAVVPNQSLAKVADTHDIYIKANIEEKDILKIRKGQAVTVVLDAYKGKKFKGRVRQISPVTSAAISGNPTSFSTSGTYTKVIQLIPVEIVLSEQVDLSEILGTNATVKINLKAEPEEEVTTEKTENIVENKTVTASGKVQSDNIRNIGVEFGAIIEEIYVSRGQKVTLGEPLVKLDASAFHQSMLDKENSLRQGRLDLEVTANNLQGQQVSRNQKQSEYTAQKGNEGGIQLRENEYNQALAMLNRAEQDLQKYQELYAAGAVSKAELEGKENMVEDAGRSLASKKIAWDNEILNRNQNLEKMQSGLSQESIALENTKLAIQSRKEQLDTLERSIQQDKDKLNKPYMVGDVIQSDLSKAMVVELPHLVGDTIPANGKILQLVDLDHLKVEIYLPEEIGKRVQKGDPAEVCITTDDTKKYKGRIRSISAGPIEVGGQSLMLVEVAIEVADDRIVPGDPVEVRINP